jgi:hypothetical protein
LSTIKLLAVIGNRAAFLHDASAHLIVRRIGVDVELLVMVRIGRERECLLSLVNAFYQMLVVFWTSS